jgi:hypothetical protein
MSTASLGIRMGLNAGELPAWNSLGKTSAKYGEILGPVQSNHGYFRFIRNNNRPIAQPAALYQNVYG